MTNIRRRPTQASITSRDASRIHALERIIKGKENAPKVRELHDVYITKTEQDQFSGGEVIVYDKDRKGWIPGSASGSGNHEFLNLASPETHVMTSGSFNLVEWYDGWVTKTGGVRDFDFNPFVDPESFTIAKPGLYLIGVNTCYFYENQAAGSRTGQRQFSWDGGHTYTVQPEQVHDRTYIPVGANYWWVTTSANELGPWFYMRQDSGQTLYYAIDMVMWRINDLDTWDDLDYLRTQVG